jgi:adenylate cyclase
LERKLTAILCADVYGYSRLMGEDEEGTLRTLSAYRKIADSLIERHHGRLVNSAGDSILADFARVVEAVSCAVALQTTIKAENAQLPVGRRMQFRIGVNLGDVMIEGEQIYGDGVNVAARLESLADPGGICISGTAHDQVRDKLPLAYEDRGERSVKNITRPVRVWRVLLDRGALPQRETPRIPRKYWRTGVFSFVGLAIIVGTFVIVQHLSLRPPPTHASIPVPEKPELPLPSIPSIAVLPFTNLSGDPQQEYFSDGISDELITDLARQPDLFVIARNSSFAYKGKPIKEHDIGKELGVKYVLEGSVQRAGSRVRISAQLVDAGSGADLWAQRFDRPLSDIFALQDDVVKKIVSTLDLQVGLRQQGVPGVVIRQKTDNLEAYDDFLRGLTYFNIQTKEDNAKALQMFEKAVKVDSEYADAYTWIGVACGRSWEWGWSKDRDTLQRGLESAHKAIALDDANPLAHAVFGRELVDTFQYVAAIAEAERAIELAPFDADAHSLAAETLTLEGKPNEAIEIAKVGMRLDPVNAEWSELQIGIAYASMRRFREAIPLLTRFLNDNPRSVGARVILVVCYVELGIMDQAKAQAAEVLRLDPQYSLEEGFSKDFPSWSPWISDLRKAGLN